MTITVVNEGTRYQGLSSDTKPLGGDPPGTTFYETDTDRLFRWTGTAWDEDVARGGTLAAGAAYIGAVGGTTVTVSDEFTRVADTNVYAVGDGIGATVSDSGTTPLRSIVVGAANGATGYLTKFRLETNQVACVAAIRVHFFTVAAPATAIPGDNVGMKISYANRAQRIGQIDFPALATTNPAGASDAARATDLTTRLAFQCDAADNKVYYRMETLTVFTPASGQGFFLALTAERNGA